jgi:hypothetical protein
MFGGFPFGAPSFGDAPDASSNPSYTVPGLAEILVQCEAHDVVVRAGSADYVVRCDGDDEVVEP